MVTRTIKDGIKFNFFKQALEYYCSCGEWIDIPIDDLVPDQFVDYHGLGCAGVFFPHGQVAHYRQEAGLTQLGN